MSAVGNFTALGLFLLSGAARAESEAEACAALATWSDGAADIQILEAMHYSNRALRTGPPGSPELVLPSHCHVTGKFERRTGRDGSGSGPGYTATQYNISEFISRGGKQLFFHGEADPWFSANETERYFNAMAAGNTSLKSVEDYSRLYLVPGMRHCSGGEQTLDNFDMLTPLVEWVENNQAPAAIVTTGLSMPRQSRPLCPYPGYAQYEGGDASEAASYSCRKP